MNKKNSTSLTAIVLAGGQSSRMGQDKALIKFQGRPLLSQVCQLASSCASQVYVVTPWTEKYSHILPNSCQLIKEVPLRGKKLPHGPLVGFAQGLARVKTEWVLLLACDLPQLRLSEMQQWTKYLTDVSSEAIALLPKHPKGWEPLCGFYRSLCLPLLNNFINQGGRSFQYWLKQYPVQELPINDPQILFNCNTPEDFKQINTSQ